jgi:LPS-assembly protein
MIPALTSRVIHLRPALIPCYGSRLRRFVPLCASRSTPTQEPTPRPQERAIFLRNIFALKCHEQFFASGAAVAALCFGLLASPASAQLPPTFIPPVPTQPNVQNPNERLKIQRPDAPGPNDVIVKADSQESDGDLRHLRGHVHLETFDKKLEADEVDYNEDTKDVEARGNVHFENFVDGTKLNCDHGTYNVDTQNGIFYEVNGIAPSKIVSRPGLLTSTNPFYFEGKWAEHKEDHYIVHDGFITDCKVPKPWWRLTAPRFDIVQYDRAIAYRAVFHIKNLPLFYAPVYYKSLKKVPRQSGFMTPNIGRSSLYGIMLGLSYYWAISRSYDTFYRIQYLSSRGFAHTYDFRGKITPGTDVSFNLYGVNDRGVNIGNGVIQKQGGLQFTFDVKTQLPDGWDGKLEINYLSSFLFRQSFSQSFHEAIFSESHSVGFLDKHWSYYGINIVADRDEEFQSITKGDEIVIKKLPEVEFFGRDDQIVSGPLPLWLSFDTSAGLMDRGQPATATANAITTPTFVNRIDVYPHVKSAFHFAGFNFLATASVRETQYGDSIADNNLPNIHITGTDILRSAREASLEILPPSLERIYNAPKWMGGGKLKHVIEPRIEYKYVTGIDDFTRLIRFDETDIMNNTNQLTLSIVNRLFLKNKDGNVSEILTWEVSQARYFDPTFGGAVVAGQRNVIESSEELDGFNFISGPRTYSPVVSSLRIQQRIGFEWRLDYDPLFHHITNSSFNADARWSKYFVNVGDSLVHTDPVIAPNSNQAHFTVGFGNSNRKGWNGATSVYYDLMRDVLVFATTEVTYNTDCCGISVEYRRFNLGIRDDTQYRVSFAVSNIGSFGTLRKQERMY